MASPSPIAVNLTVMALLITAVASATPAATSYVNHTVGGDAGWFFNSSTNTTVADYSKWAANQTFNLGDYLIFRTSSNQTVVQTYNETTYKSCSTDDALDSDTFLYDVGIDQFGQPLSIAVPLTIEGPNYYFSDADDGVQCQQGMAFQITVDHGLGLPPSLNQPPPPPYSEPPPPPDSSLSPPSTVAGGSNGGAVGADANVRLVVGMIILSVAGSFLVI
ncbi:Phytocyanin domain [Dillenia turbinata]|uniref:Phytocyanin domain n=1 Tax=Dillenia turbinata TaxID=194707 RepID=A0AAN8Z008_9MAGN